MNHEHIYKLNPISDQFINYFSFFIQERLKLEKEKLRLHELELKEREHELKAHLDHSSSNTKPTTLESNDHTNF